MLSVPFGATVVLDLLGHSAVNGAVIPETATVALTSNDVTVATVPAAATVPAGGAEKLTDLPVTILAAGSTDLHGTVTLADGTVFEDTVTLVVTPAPQPGLARVELQLRQTS